jgi:PKHD-type hydroxylase
VFLVFDSVMNTADVRQLRTALLPEKFSDGALTAHGDAQRVKKNMQLTASHPHWAKCSDVVLNAVRACVPMMLHTMPVRMTPPTFNLYSDGMHYGPHTDAALMSAGGLPMRTDYSMTVFLSDPEEYEGGELVFKAIEDFPMAAKLKAGSAVVYPSNTLHEVRPVTQGARFAAILWMQSALPLEQQRTAIQALDQVRKLMDGGDIEGAKERLRLTREDLVRLFAQP